MTLQQVRPARRYTFAEDVMSTQHLVPPEFRIVGLVVGIPGFLIRLVVEVWWELRDRQNLRVSLEEV